MMESRSLSDVQIHQTTFQTSHQTKITGNEQLQIPAAQVWFTFWAAAQSASHFLQFQTHAHSNFLKPNFSFWRPARKGFIREPFPLIISRKMNHRLNYSEILSVINLTTL
jgi:hypothetical protein